MVPSKVVASPARRAQDTARLACGAWGGAVTTEPRLWEAAVSDLEAVVAAHGPALYVGHNPGFEMFARRHGVEAHLRPCSLVVFTREASGAWSPVDVVDVKDLA